MADDEKRYNFGNTNAEELLFIWEHEEDWNEEMEEYILASFDFFGRLIEKIKILANIPNILFNYNDILYTIKSIADPGPDYDYVPYGDWENIYLNGKDGKIKYILVISFEIVEKGNYGKCYVYPHCINENGKVEIFDTANKTWVNTTWEITDSRITGLLDRESGDWVGENLVEAFQNLADILCTCSTVDEVGNILWKNQKLFALYRTVKSFVDLKTDNRWSSEDMICLVPKDPFRKHLSIIQIKDSLILGCITNLEDGNPKFVEIYDIDHVDIMAELLKIFCREGVYKREDGSGVEWGSGHILSYESENGVWVLDDTFTKDHNLDDIPIAYRNNEEAKNIPRNVEKLFSLDEIVKSFDEISTTLWVDDVYRAVGIGEARGWRSNLMVIQLEDQLVLGCKFYSDEDDLYSIKFITIHDTDSIDEMVEILKILYMLSPYEFDYFANLNSGDVYPFKVY